MTGRYEIDKDDFRIRKVRPSAAKIIRRCVKYFFVSIALAVIYYILFALVFSTDTERRLKQENRMYAKLYPDMAEKEALLNAVTFGLFIGCVEAYSHDVPVRWVLCGVVLLAVVATIYVRMQLGERYPMLPFDLLKIPIFSMSVMTSILSFTAQMMSLIAMPFLLVNTFHYDAVGTGLLMTSWPLVIVFVAPLAGILIGKIHPGILGGVGLIIMSIGCFSLSFVPTDTNHFGLVWRLMLCGMGFGFFQSPNNHMLLTSAPPQRTGSASGMLATARLTGQTIGAALVALLFHIYGDTAPHDAMLLAGILTLCGALSSALRLRVSLPK